MLRGGSGVTGDSRAAGGAGRHGLGASNDYGKWELRVPRTRGKQRLRTNYEKIWNFTVISRDFLPYFYILWRFYGIFVLFLSF